MTALDQRVINQYSYVNFYEGEQAEVLKTVLREVNENPGTRLTWLSFDGQKAQAHFTLPKVKP